MNRKSITHGLKITAIIIAAFVAASLTPARSFAKTADIENRPVATTGKVIIDNEMPLAAEPSGTDVRMTLGWIIIAAAAVMTGIVIVEDFKDRRHS